MAHLQKLATVVLSMFLVTCLMSFGSFPKLPGQMKLCLVNAHAEEVDETLPPEETEQPEQIKDPLEPINRVFFHFNDKLYFWVLKPISRVYKAVIPPPLRKGIRNAFYNIRMPMRFVNDVLQGKPQKAGAELARFVINSTVGIGGLVDVADREFHLRPHDEDLGQTFGRYGMGPGIYINWPIFGPSSPRDTVGMVGDFFLDPIFYLSPDLVTEVGIGAGEKVNRTSLSLGEYEDLKASAVDPYIAVRNAYYQHRKAQVKE